MAEPSVMEVISRFSASEVVSDEIRDERKLPMESLLGLQRRRVIDFGSNGNIVTVFQKIIVGYLLLSSMDVVCWKSFVVAWFRYSSILILDVRRSVKTVRRRPMLASGGFGLLVETVRWAC